MTGLGYGEVGGLMMKVTLWGVVAGELVLELEVELEDCDIFLVLAGLRWWVGGLELWIGCCGCRKSGGGYAVCLFGFLLEFG